VARPAAAALAALRAYAAAGDGAAASADAAAAGHYATAAVAATRARFPDSRHLPDAWYPTALLAAALAAAGQAAASAAFWADAGGIAEAGGSERAAAAGPAPHAARAHTPRAPPAPPASGPPLEPPAPASPLIVFVSAFDNVGSFAQQGVPLAAVLRAHLHRALLAADAIALPPQFLLNCRPFLAEVLFGGCGDAALAARYLAHIYPVLPASQTVDYGAAGGGRQTIDLAHDATPFRTARRRLQVENPGFLHEAVDDSLVAAVDDFYAAHRDRILWYDMGAVGGAYGRRVAALVRAPDAVEAVLGTGAAERHAYAATAAWVAACMAGGAALNRSLMYKWGNLFRTPSSAATFASECARQLAGGDAGALVEARRALAERPWVFDPLLRAIADAPYNTALPMALGVSMIVDGGDAVQLRLAGVAAAGEPDGALVLPALAPAAALRVTELARLPLATVLALRRSSPALAYRAAVQRLQRVAVRAARTAAAAAAAATPATASTPPAAPRAPALSRAGSDAVSITGSSAEAVVEGRAAAANEAAARYHATIAAALRPVDARPLPALDLGAYATRDTSASALAAVASDVELLSKFAADAGGSGVVVSKADAILPTFAIPALPFPGVVPIVRPTAVVVGGSSGGSATGGGVAAEKGVVECLEEVTAYREAANKWVHLRFDRVRFPSGAEGRHNIVVEFGGLPAPGVVILPVTPAGDVLLLRQHRYPVAAWSWELPRGGPEAGRSPDTRAGAEREEERGYGVDAGNLVPLSAPDAPAWPNNGISSTSVAFFLARNVTPLAAGHRREASEAIDRVRAVPQADLRAMIEDGDIRDGFTLAAVGLALARGELWANGSGGGGGGGGGGGRDAYPLD